MRPADELSQLLRRTAHLRSQGFYEDALDAARSACRLARTSLGPKDRDFRTALNGLAVLYKLTGSNEEAETLYIELLTIARDGQAQRSPEMWTALNNLGLLYVQMGRFSDAEPLLKEGVEIARSISGEESEEYATSLNNLGGLYQEAGSYSAARASFSRALEITRALHGELHGDTAQTLNNLGLACLNHSEHAEAEVCFRGALETRRTILQPQHPDIAQSLNNLGLCLQARGDYAASDPLFREALRINAQVFGETHPEVAITMTNLARLYEQTGYYSKAWELHWLAVESFRKSLGNEHPSARNALNNLALLCVESGRFNEAEPLLEEALQLARSAVGETHADFAQCLNNVGLLRLNSGKPSEAEPLFRRAWELRSSLPDISPEHLTTSLSNLALAMMDNGRHDDAKPLMEEVIRRRIALHGEEHPSVEQAMFNLGVLYAKSGQSTEALRLLKTASRIDSQILDQVFAIGSDERRLACLNFVYQRLQIFLSVVVEKLAGSTTAVEAAFHLVLRRKGIAADLMASQRQGILQGRYPHLAEALQELSAVRAQIAQQSLAVAEPKNDRAISRLEFRRERLEAELAAQIPEIARKQQVSGIDASTVAELLPPNAVLIEFVRIQRNAFPARISDGSNGWLGAYYIAFVLIAGAEPRIRLIDLGLAEPIDSLICGFRSSIRGGDRHFVVEDHDASAAATTGEELRCAIFDPLLNVIGRRRRLLIAPDGDLCLVPFEALSAADGKPLIDEYHISYLTTARDLLRLGAQGRSVAGESLVVGDPQFDLAPAEDAIEQTHEQTQHRQSRDFTRAGQNLFQRLPGTRRECDAIARLLGVTPLFGEASTEGRIKGCASPLVLHLATHGFFLGDQQQQPNKLNATSTSPMRWTALGGLENPMLRSGLALAGANTWLRGHPLSANAEDGILNAEDLSGLDLTATELVVLSACETGLGELRVGEGVFGLRRAVIIAGAKTLLMSLWKVPDQQTEELMGEFYRHLQAGEPRAEALRQAQLSLKARYPHPFYWGAFICQGDPGPLLPK